MSDRPQDSPALDLAGALDGGETVDLMGNALAPAFYESARSRSLEDELGSEARPVLLTFAERDSRTAAAAEALADRLQGRGFDVTFELDPIADSFWLVGGDYAPVEDAPETASQLERVGNWFHRQLPLPSPAPPSRELPAPAAAPPADGAHPIFIPAAAETLFGMITVPATDTDTGAIVLQFGNSTMSTHRNGLWHRVAGSLAQAGVATLRFDYHGVGCSSGTASEFRTDRPFTTDLAAAADWMVKHGYNKLLLFGECYGARTAMAQAAAIPGLAGLFLVAPGLRDHLQPVMRANSWAKDYGLGRYVRRALSLETLRSLGNKQARVAYRRIAAAKIRFMGRRLRKAKPRAGGDLSWVSPAFIEQLQNVVDRRLPVHFVYGTADGHNDLRTAMQGELGRVAESGGDLVELTVREGKIHGGGTRLEVQDDIAGLAIKWASAVAPPAARTGG